MPDESLQDASSGARALAGQGRSAGGDGPVPVVGLGASAGGLKALEHFFDALPEETGCAFVVVVHLDPERESSLAELLARHTLLPVAQATGRTAIEADHVYVIPPNRQIAVGDGHLELAPFEEARGRRMPLDYFFRSLARRGEAATGIILSGGGTDGTVGLKAIHEHGGFVMAQDPEDAEHGAMPRSALATGVVDVVGPAGELAARLLEFQRDRARIRLADADADADADDRAGALEKDREEALQKVFAQLRVRTEHDFSGYKRSTLLRRIGRRMQMNQVETLPAYAAFLREHEEETTALLQDVLISVTNFFRDPDVWEQLEEEVVPRLFEGKGPDDRVRAWVIGCATGEEAYSAAMLLIEHADTLDRVAPQIQVFASDIDEQALRNGREGVYPEAIAGDVTEARLERFFVKEGDHYRISSEVRDRVLFAKHNVLKDPPFSKLDLITCRNLFIYLRRKLQQTLFELFHYALHPGGFLLLGNAETLDGHSDFFETIGKKQRIFRRRMDSESHLPALPTSSFALPPQTRQAPSAVAGPGPEHDAPLAMPPRPGGAELHTELLETLASIRRRLGVVGGGVDIDSTPGIRNPRAPDRPAPAHLDRRGRGNPGRRRFRRRRGFRRREFVRGGAGGVPFGPPGRACRRPRTLSRATN